jgi:lipoyl(octanoyl) transferase
MTASSMQGNLDLVFRDLGRMSYDAALAEQRRTHAAVVAGDLPPTVLLVEHDPVITLSRRPGVRDHLIASESLLEQHGVTVAQTDRGGDITYHGPGQIVAYPIVRLNDLGLNLRQYVWRLEQAIIDCLATFGLTVGRDTCAVGVWTRPGEKDSAKIAAIGVRASRWVTMHGLALNVTTDLDHFKLIIPCGLAGRAVTTLLNEQGDACPPIQHARDVLCQCIEQQLLDPTSDDAALPRRSCS